MIDPNFKDWVSKISQEYKKSQIKAAIKVNGELIRFYYFLGEQINKTSFKKQYGEQFYIILSSNLKNELPGTKGLSERNLRYCENFYILYKKILPQLVAKLEMVPWGHHRCIIDKSKNTEKSMFYIEKTIENNWSRNELQIALK